MASTVGGQRRILKRKGSVLEYIRQAVESGVYRTDEELEKVWKERRESALELRVIMNRFRQDIVRGSNIHDYPIEYLIHEQHPVRMSALLLGGHPASDIPSTHPLL